MKKTRTRIILATIGTAIAIASAFTIFYFYHENRVDSEASAAVRPIAIQECTRLLEERALCDSMSVSTSTAYCGKDCRLVYARSFSDREEFRASALVYREKSGYVVRQFIVG